MYHVVATTTKSQFPRCSRTAASCYLTEKPASVFGNVAANTQSQHTGHTLHHNRHLLYHLVATTTKSQFSRRSHAAARCYLTTKPAFVFGYAAVNTQSQHTGHTRHHDRHLLYHAIATTTKSQFSQRSCAAASCYLVAKPASVFGYAAANTQSQYRGHAHLRDRHLLYIVVATTTKSQFSQCSRNAASCS